MDAYTLPDGRTVRFTGPDIHREVIALYAVINAEYKGSDSVEFRVIKSVLASLEAGKPLADAEWNIVNRLSAKYGAEVAKLKRSPDWEGQDPVLPQGTGRVSESFALMPPSMRARMREVDAASTTKLDKETSIAHLHDSVVHDLAHALQHVQRLQDKDVEGNSDSVQFNIEHALTHLKSGLDHAQRLGGHLETDPSSPKTFKAERQRLNDMRAAAN